jgi:hypothetical protein
VKKNPPPEWTEMLNDPVLLEELRQQNFINMTCFFQKELRELDGGCSLSQTTINAQELKVLKELGIVIPERVKGFGLGAGVRYPLSPFARFIVAYAPPLPVETDDPEDDE